MPFNSILKAFKKIKEPGELRRLLANASWLAYDRVFRLALNLFVVGWMARYLGPKLYGNYDYATSITMVVGVIAAFGTNSIVVRDLVRNRARTAEILGSAFLIRQFGGILSVIISIAVVFILNPNEPMTQLLVVVVSVTYLFASVDVVDLYFQSLIKSKYSVIANNTAFFLLSIIRILLIVYKAPLMAFAIAGTAEVAVAQIGMLIVYRRVSGHFVFKWKWNFVLAKQMFHDSWPLMLAAASQLLLLKISQVMLGNLVSYKELGEYSAAVKISEVWYFVPFVIYTTMYPKLIEFRAISNEQYMRRMQDYFSIMVFISYLAVIPTFFLNEWIIYIIFGSQYVKASFILGIHIWAGLFVAMTTARNTWCNIENDTRSVLYSTLAGALLNIALNVPLIKLYGGVGAAVSVMIARVITGFLSTLFMSRAVFIMQVRSLFLHGFWRIVKEDILK
ncbi:MAG TPA: flippase [Spirochaetota bacterium]|nr:flippase [Spirochaetota bacterium]HPV41896.1 flippase [Spirochaetota bacterium]